MLSPPFGSTPEWGHLAKEKIVRILSVIAHPDYAVLTIGGTLIKHAEAGDDLFVVSLSPGELGIGSVLFPKVARSELVQLRTKELQTAGKILGVQEVRILGMEDTAIENTAALRATLADLIRELKPDMILSHWQQDAHPDLRNTGQAAADANLPACLGYLKGKYPAHSAKKVYTFGMPSAIDFVPDVLIDVTSVIERKIEAANSMESVRQEIVKLRYPDSPDKWTEFFLVQNLYWGQEAGVRYAEAFKLVKAPATRRAVAALPF